MHSSAANQESATPAAALQDPKTLKRLICIFPHLPMALKLFGRPAEKDKNNIIISSALNPQGGREATINFILATIDQGIVNLLKDVETDNKVPNIFEVILIVEGNGGSTGNANSIIGELLERLQQNCTYLKFAKTDENIAKVYQGGKIPLICYTLGTGSSPVVCPEPLTCDEISEKYNADRLNSKTRANHTAIGQYLSHESLEKVREMMGELQLSPFPISALSPTSVSRKFSFPGSPVYESSSTPQAASSPMSLLPSPSSQAASTPFVKPELASLSASSASSSPQPPVDFQPEPSPASAKALPAVEEREYPILTPPKVTDHKIKNPNNLSINLNLISEPLSVLEKDHKLYGRHEAQSPQRFFPPQDEQARKASTSQTKETDSAEVKLESVQLTLRRQKK